MERKDVRGKIDNCINVPISVICCHHVADDTENLIISKQFDLFVRQKQNALCSFIAEVLF